MIDDEGNNNLHIQYYFNIYKTIHTYSVQPCLFFVVLLLRILCSIDPLEINVIGFIVFTTWFRHFKILFLFFF